MESLRVAGRQGRQTTCVDARQIQRINMQAEVVLGKEHVLPYPEDYENPDEEELLGVEYAMCQSTAFTARQYYAQKAEEEQSRDEEEESAATAGVAEETGEEEEELADEGVDVSEELADEGVDVSEEDPIDSICGKHAVLTQAEQVEEDSPALQDVLVTRLHLHLPGIEEVEALALLLLELADDSNHHLVPVDLRQKSVIAAGSLHERDKTAANFVKKYESRWGYTLFGRCLGADTPESSAAQKTKFGWMRYPQAAQVTEDSRLLYLLIKILKNRPPSNHFTSPSKITASIKGQYKRIADRVRDDPVFCSLSIPLPNINSKSISSFIVKEEKKANYRATVMPKAKPHRTVLSDQPLPEAPALPSSLLPPDRPQVQYEEPHHVTGKRHGEKRRLDFEDPGPSHRPIQPKPAAAASYVPPAVSAAPVLLVVPAQPQASSIRFTGPSFSQVFVPVVPPPAPTIKPVIPSKSEKPCGACRVPQCGGQRKRYIPSKDKVAGSSQKIVTFCPATRKSTTAGFDGVVYDSFEHFKNVVDEELTKRKAN